MRRRALLAGAGMLAFAPRPAPADTAGGALGRILRQGELRVGAYLGAPPWSAHDAFGQPDGSEVALARQLALDLGARLRLVSLLAGEQVPALEAGRVDVVASLPLRAGLFRRIALARPHGRLLAIMAGRPGLRLRGFADLAGRSVALPLGTAVAEAVHPRLPPDAVAVFLPDQGDCLAALMAGEVDAAAAFDWSVQAVLVADHDAPVERGFPVMDAPLALAVALGERDLLRFLDTFLMLRAEDGTLDALHRRYFVSPPPGPEPRP